MSQTEQMLILACKGHNQIENPETLSDDPLTYVLDVYKEQFYAEESEEQQFIALTTILGTIVDKYLTHIKTTKILTELHPNERWRYTSNPEVSYNEMAVLVLMSIIRLSEVSYFGDMFKK